MRSTLARPAPTRELARFAELTLALALRDVSTRYKHSLLGLYWGVINPLLMAFVFAFVFSTLLHAAPGRVPYVAFLVTGLTVWNLFGNGLMSAVGSVVNSASLLAKIRFPREILPTAAVLARLVDFGFSLVAVAIILAVYRVGFSVTLVLLPVIVGIELLFTLGLGYVVAALQVLYRDVSQILGIVVMLWMYVSPVMYDLSTVHQQIKNVLLFNPMASILVCAHDVLLYHTWPPWGLLLNAWWISLGTLVMGRLVFSRLSPVFGEIL